MSSAFWWYVLAGFIVGFSLSTLWEWLYFRMKRVRAIERAVAEQTAARPPADTQWDIVAEETPQPDSVWATSTAQDPGVYLEMEDPDLAAQTADNAGEGLAAAAATVEPEIRPIMVATPQPDAAPVPTTTVNIVNVPPSYQAEDAAPPAPSPPAIAPDPQIVLLTAAIEQLARAMEKSPPGAATGSTAPAVHPTASPDAGASMFHAFSQGTAPTRNSLRRQPARRRYHRKAGRRQQLKRLPPHRPSTSKPRSSCVPCRRILKNGIARLAP